VRTCPLVKLAMAHVGIHRCPEMKTSAIKISGKPRALVRKLVTVGPAEFGRDTSTHACCILQVKAYSRSLTIAITIIHYH
jgi:hypothetical protein